MQVQGDTSRIYALGGTFIFFIMQRTVSHIFLLYAMISYLQGTNIRLLLISFQFLYFYVT